MKPITIQDIATAANVSKSTVSRVLNSSASVNPEKRKAVEDAIAELGFRPNSVARSLAKGRSMTVGVMTQNIGSPFYDAAAQGVIAGLSGDEPMSAKEDIDAATKPNVEPDSDAASLNASQMDDHASSDSGFSPLFVDGQWLPSREKRVINSLLNRRVDGLILIGGNLTAAELENLCGSVPLVLAARNIADADFCCVSVDNVDGGYQATKHLIDLGHRDIAFIRGIEDQPDAVDRFVGFQKAMRESGYSISEDLILDGDFSPESAVEATHHLVDSNASFTALMACNDMMAFAARLALSRRGISVPDECSLVGFDDQMESAFVTPPLTTVHQPAREVGRTASRYLLHLLNGEPVPSKVFRSELVIRESTRAVSTP